MDHDTGVVLIFVIFFALLIIIAVYIIYDAKHGESSFRENIVSVDTANITSINIYPKFNLFISIN